jgi:LPXTG-motif cell wall-anchored protein
MRTQMASLITMLLSTGAALAQTTAQTPSPAPDGTGGIRDYWWLIIVVVLIAIAVWYFMRNRKPRV